MAGRLHQNHVVRHAPFRAEFSPDLGWAIFDARDVRCSAWDKDGARMNDRADGLNSNIKPKAGPRNCMCCQTPFASAGIHNRMCDRCRSKADPLDPVRPYVERRAG